MSSLQEEYLFDDGEFEREGADRDQATSVLLALPEPNGPARQVDGVPIFSGDGPDAVRRASPGQRTLRLEAFREAWREFAEFRRLSDLNGEVDDFEYMESFNCPRHAEPELTMRIPFGALRFYCSECFIGGNGLQDLANALPALRRPYLRLGAGVAEDVALSPCTTAPTTEKVRQGNCPTPFLKAFERTGEARIKPLSCRTKSCPICGPIWRDQTLARFTKVLVTADVEVYRVVFGADEGLAFRALKRRIQRSDATGIAGRFLRLPLESGESVVYTTMAVGALVDDLRLALQGDFARAATSKANISASAAWSEPPRSKDEHTGDDEEEPWRPLDNARPMGKVIRALIEQGSLPTGSENAAFNGRRVEWDLPDDPVLELLMVGLTRPTPPSKPPLLGRFKPPG